MELTQEKERVQQVFSELAAKGKGALLRLEVFFYKAFNWNTLKVYKRNKGERSSGRYSSVFSQSHVSQCVSIISYKAAQKSSTICELEIVKGVCVWDRERTFFFSGLTSVLNGLSVDTSVPLLTHTHTGQAVSCSHFKSLEEWLSFSVLWVVPTDQKDTEFQLVTTWLNSSPTPPFLFLSVVHPQDIGVDVVSVFVTKHVLVH